MATYRVCFIWSFKKNKHVISHRHLTEVTGVSETGLIPQRSIGCPSTHPGLVPVVEPHLSESSLATVEEELEPWDEDRGSGSSWPRFTGEAPVGTPGRLN